MLPSLPLCTHTHSMELYYTQTWEQNSERRDINDFTVGKYQYISEDEFCIAENTRQVFLPDKRYKNIAGALIWNSST